MQDNEKYPYVGGKGEINEVLAVCEMTVVFESLSDMMDKKRLNHIFVGTKYYRWN